MTPNIAYFVKRPQEYEALKEILIGPGRETVAILAPAALRGANGAGSAS